MKNKLMKNINVGLACVMLVSLMTGCGKAEDVGGIATEPIPENTVEEAAPETEDQNASVANPWTDITEEEAVSLCPRMFKAPDGATGIRWSKNESAGSDSVSGAPLVQLDFNLDGMDYTARAQYGAEENADISGMYYDWAVEDDVVLANWGMGNMQGRMCRAIDDQGYADLCTWYDIEIGIAYSLSVTAPDLDGFDISAVAAAMYNPDNEPYTGPDDDEEASVIEVHDMVTDISGCDTFTQIVDKLPEGQGYANVKLGDTDVLLVSSGTYDDLDGHDAAIDAEVFFYDPANDNAIGYLGYLESGGTAYPLAEKDGVIFSAGNHFVTKSTVTDGILAIMEEARVDYDTDGNATYTYNSDDGGVYSGMDSDEAEGIFDELLGEMAEADIISFVVVSR